MKEIIVVPYTALNYLLVTADFLYVTNNLTDRCRPKCAMDKALSLEPQRQ